MRIEDGRGPWRPFHEGVLDMKWVLTSIAAVAALATGPVNAADIPVKAPPRMMAASWTGCHIGGQLGMMRSEDTRWFYGATSLSPGPGAAATASFNFGSFLAGGQLGCDWQTRTPFAGGTIVLGLEGDGAWNDADKRTVETAFTSYLVALEQHWLATVRGRIGVAWDKSMLYFTGGGAWAGLRAGNYIPNTTTATFQDRTQSGWTVGAGYEVMLINNWSAKFEYLFVDLGTPSFFSPADSVALAEFHTRLREHVFRLGLNWKFSPIAP
jgi:outer membrane immunogenic protein